MKKVVLPAFIVSAILIAGVSAYQWQHDRAPAAQNENMPALSTSTEIKNNEASIAPPAPPTLTDKYCKDPHTTTCDASFPSVDPTGQVRSDVAGEVRALRYMRDIIHKNPTWTSEQVQESLTKSIYTDSRRKIVEDGFAWVLKNMQKLINEQPSSVFSEQEKTALLERLAMTHLDLPPSASYDDAPDLVTKNTVYYERIKQETFRLRLGGAYLLNTTSWYNVIFTLGHELAHAIDPCEASYANFRPKAYDDLVACFVESGWVEQNKTVCGPDEQISEVFADWIASELVSRALAEKGTLYSKQDKARSAINATHDLCAQSSSVDSLNISLHQQPEVRIGSILGKNPYMRKTLGCEPTPKKAHYCAFKTLRPTSPPEASP